MSATRRRQPLLWLPSDGHDRAAGDDGFLLVLLLRRPSNFGAHCCSLLRPPHPWASATVRYNSEDTYAHRNLRMLQTEKARRFAKSKRQYIEALVEYAKEEATLSKLRTQLASQQSYIHEDIHSLRRRNSELTDELKDLSLQVQGCLSEIKFHILSHQRLARSCKDSDASSVCYLNTDQLMKCLLSL